MNINKKIVVKIDNNFDPNKLFTEDWINERLKRRKDLINMLPINSIIYLGVDWERMK